MKKGFTLIELIVVIAVLGILVLLAAPKFLGYTTEAKEIQMRVDIKAIEQQLTVEQLENKNFYENWVTVENAEMEQRKNDGKLVDKKGKVDQDMDMGGEYYIVDIESPKSRLPGDFIYDVIEGDVYYYDKDLNIKDNTNTPGENGTPGGNENPGGNNPIPEDPNADNDKDGFTNAEEDAANTDKNNPNDFPAPVDPWAGLTPSADSNFRWVSGTEQGENNADRYSFPNESFNGYYQYIGSESVVVVPKTIKGNEVNNYYRMFNASSRNVKKVIAPNPNVTSYNSMFLRTKATELDLTELNSDSVTTMKNMFAYSESLTSIDMGIMSNPKLENVDSMFNNTYKLTTLKMTGFNTPNVTNMINMFWAAGSSTGLNVDIKHFDTSNVTTMRSMFGASGIPNLSENIANWKTSNVTDMASMFASLRKTPTLTVPFDTSNVTDMSNMFYNSAFTSLDISKMKTANVKNMSTMFSKFEGLNTINLDHFNTSNVTKMNGMFNESKFTSLNLNLNTSEVTDMSNMFNSVTLSNLDISSFDTSKVTTMLGIFQYAKITNWSLGEFNGDSLTSLDGAYLGAKVPSINLSHIDLSKVSTSSAFSSVVIANNTIYARTADLLKINTQSSKPSSVTSVGK